MKEFYDNLRDDKSYIILAENNSVLYPPHFHAVFELFIVKKGNYVCMCNGKEFSVCDNSVAIFDHYDIHAYLEDNSVDSFQYIITIPPKYLTRFNELREGKRFANNVIVDAQLCDDLIFILDKFLPPNGHLTKPYATEATIDLIFSQLLYKMQFVDEELHVNDFDLIKKILSHIEKNFKEDISRTSIAKSLGYTESHISRTFHKYIGHSIPHHINLLRIDYIDKQKKKDKSKNIIQLIMDAGFKSVQSYYRNKKANSPSQNI